MIIFVPDAESGQPDHPPPPLDPPPPANPLQEEAGNGDETACIGDDSVADAIKSGSTEIGPSIDSGAMHAAVLEALSDPAVVHPVVSNSH